MLYLNTHAQILAMDESTATLVPDGEPAASLQMDQAIRGDILQKITQYMIEYNQFQC